MRPRIDFRTASKAAYQSFASEHPQAGITRQQYCDIIYGFNGALVDHMLNSGEMVKLPFGLGSIAIAKYRPKKHKTFAGATGQPVTIIGLPIDWSRSRKAGTLIYHLNAHTDGYRFRWKWFNKGALFDCARFFSFKPNRGPSRQLAQYLKSDPKYAQIYRQWAQR